MRQPRTTQLPTGRPVGRRPLVERSDAETAALELQLRLRSLAGRCHTLAEARRQLPLAATSLLHALAGVPWSSAAAQALLGRRLAALTGRAETLGDLLDAVYDLDRVGELLRDL